MVPCHQRGGMPKSDPYVAPDVYDPPNHSGRIKANGTETTSSLSAELPLARKGPMNGLQGAGRAALKAYGTRFHCILRLMMSSAAERCCNPAKPNNALLGTSRRCALGNATTTPQANVVLGGPDPAAV